MKIFKVFEPKNPSSITSGHIHYKYHYVKHL